jgi:AcrR family transcriptional regulator
MPTKTFGKLSPARQKEILDAAFHEFALNDYDTASLGNIIKKLGIAKGTFYRYFVNKRDLYHYLLEYATKERLAQVGELFSQKSIDFNKLIIENFSAKIRFELENPLISGFLYNVLQERNELLGNLQLEMKKKIIAIVVDLLEQNRANWKLSKDVPLMDMAYFIVQVHLGIFDYLELKYGISIRENIKSGKAVFDLDQKQVLKDVHSFARLLESGIKKN